jgi:hypothetical protein
VLWVLIGVLVLLALLSLLLKLASAVIYVLIGLVVVIAVWRFISSRRIS